jgi:hypothetical protein
MGRFGQENNENRCLPAGNISQQLEVHPVPPQIVEVKTGHLPVFQEPTRSKTRSDLNHGVAQS